MQYTIEFRPRAIKDLRSINAKQQARIILKIEALEQDLAGDVKRLTNFSPAYRLRVGSYRVLFGIERERVIVLSYQAQK
jgi:mRNA interferase RelE/StbE